jgi:phenylpyruvate tautomerase PptA (4-oxalocrotonate tautomerase family)
MSSTLQTKANLIKAITFTQFLNLCSALSELHDPKLFQKNPKKALAKLISDHLMKLL